MTMIMVNLTPHAITWVKPSGETQVIESSGTIRCAVATELVDEIGELRIYRNTYRLEDTLPAPVAGTYYVVSALVASALKGTRDDVLVVNDTVRDNAGRIIGCRSFARI